MARGLFSGIIAIIVCGLGMIVMAHTHWQMSNGVVASAVLPSVVPWIVGVAEGLAAIMVYRLAYHAHIGWIWTWFILFLVVALLLMIDFVRLMNNMYLLINLYGFPSLMIMGTWATIFAALLINRRWPLS